MNPQTFIQKNKVFLLGLLSAIALTVQQFATQPEVDYKVIGYAAIMAILSFIANQWRGQGVTVMGIIGTLAGAFVTIQSTGHFTWNQFILSAIAALLAAVAPPPKPLSYEHNDNIVAAKEVPPVADVKDNSSLPVGTKS